jgi:hypothetical protein
MALPSTRMHAVERFLAPFLGPSRDTKSRRINFPCRSVRAPTPEEMGVYSPEGPRVVYDCVAQSEGNRGLAPGPRAPDSLRTGSRRPGACPLLPCASRERTDLRRDVVATSGPRCPWSPRSVPLPQKQDWGRHVEGERIVFLPIFPWRSFVSPIDSGQNLGNVANHESHSHLFSI